MRVVTALAALAMALGLTCCGDDDDDKQSAPESCRTLISDWCNKVADCAISVGEVSTSQRSDAVRVCTDGANGSIDCNKAVGTSSSYSQCRSDIKAMDCSIYKSTDIQNMEMPATCKDTILLGS